MAHHSGPDKEAGAGLRRLFREQDAGDDIANLREQLGATHRHPEGHLTDDDEGEIRIGITATEGKVVIAFGKDVEWVGFGPEQARELCQTILNRAAECDGIMCRVRRVSE